MIQSWKRHIATHAEPYLTERRSPTRRVSSVHTNAPARRAALQALRWQREYWDTFMRDEDQEKRGVEYIEDNPGKAKLCRSTETWQFSSARFRDLKTRKLLLPNPGEA